MYLNSIIYVSNEYIKLNFNRSVYDYKRSFIIKSLEMHFQFKYFTKICVSLSSV